VLVELDGLKQRVCGDTQADCHRLLLLPRFRLEDQFALLELHRHVGVVGDFAGDELAGERSFDGALKESFERAGAKDGVVAFAGDVFFGGVGQVERDVAAGVWRGSLCQKPALPPSLRRS
jgi:hypothetical protein